MSGDKSGFKNRSRLVSSAATSLATVLELTLAVLEVDGFAVAIAQAANTICKVRKVKTSKEKSTNGSALGFEATLWATADKLRGNLDAAEYKHVVLGLILLKYISDAFEEKHAALKKGKGADPEDRDEYLAENVFWVPPEARWSTCKAAPKTPSSASCSTPP